MEIYTHLADDQGRKTADQIGNAIFTRPETPGLMH